MKRRLSETLRKLDKEKGRQMMFALASLKARFRMRSKTKPKQPKHQKASQP